MTIETERSKSKITIKCDVAAAFANAVSKTNDCLKENCEYYREGSCLINCMSEEVENKGA